MPYSTERGVRSYSDNDTPAEFASGADEDRARYNEAQNDACKAADKLIDLLADLYEPPAGDLCSAHVTLDRMASQLLALVAEAERLLGRSTQVAASAVSANTEPERAAERQHLVPEDLIGAAMHLARRHGAPNVHARLAAIMGFAPATAVERAALLSTRSATP